MLILIKQILIMLILGMLKINFNHEKKYKTVKNTKKKLYKTVVQEEKKLIKKKKLIMKKKN